MKYGYKIINGKFHINEIQATEVKNIFNQYINGYSLKDIADELTARKVEYQPNMYNWNKNKVYRMLMDKIYLGTEIYPQIITEDNFNNAYEVMQKRSNQTERNNDVIFSQLIVPIRCGKCGYLTYRRYKSKERNSTKHICKNPECKMSYAILDVDLRTMIKELLMNLKQDKDETAPENCC